MADHICQFATERGMRLNPKKCREMVINFLQFQPTQLGPLLMGSVVKRVNSYKILGIHVTNDLSWNEHIDYVFKKANKRLYALRLLARSKVPVVDLIAIYCALVRSILEYGSPVWATLPEYLSDVVEGVQRKALRIVFPGLAYSEALVASPDPCHASWSSLRQFCTRCSRARATTLGAYIYCIVDKLSWLHAQVRKH